MTETQTSIRHHHNARFHLRRFGSEDGRVWRYDRTGEYNTVPKTPKGIGYEDLLYAPKDGGPDANSDAWEKWLGIIDSRAAGSVPRVEREETLNRKQRSHVAAYVAAQDLRTPLSRDQFTAAVQGGLDSWWGDIEQIKREIKESQGVEYESEEL